MASLEAEFAEGAMKTGRFQDMRFLSKIFIITFSLQEEIKSYYFTLSQWELPRYI